MCLSSCSRTRYTRAIKLYRTIKLHRTSWKLDFLPDNPDHPAVKPAVVDSRGGEVNSGRDVDRERKGKIKRMYLAEFDYEAGKHA